MLVKEEDNESWMMLIPTMRQREGPGVNGLRVPRKVMGRSMRGMRLLYSPRIGQPRGVGVRAEGGDIVVEGVGSGDGERREMNFPTMFQP